MERGWIRGTKARSPTPSNFAPYAPWDGGCPYSRETSILGRGERCYLLPPPSWGFPPFPGAYRPTGESGVGVCGRKWGSCGALGAPPLNPKGVGIGSPPPGWLPLRRVCRGRSPKAPAPVSPPRGECMSQRQPRGHLRHNDRPWSHPRHSNLLQRPPWPRPRSGRSGGFLAMSTHHPPHSLGRHLPGQTKGPRGRANFWSCNSLKGCPFGAPV